MEMENTGEKETLEDSLESIGGSGGGTTAAKDEKEEGMAAMEEGESSLPVGLSPGDESLDKGVLSPLTGSYLLIVLAEPHSSEDRDIIIKRLNQGKTSSSH